jgi:Rieske Fe-S protein
VSEIDRRRFVALAGAALAAAALPGCASLVATPVTPVAGQIRLALRNFPQLTRPGGYVKLAPRGAPTPLYVLAVDHGYAALSPVCTHLGCLVDIQGAVLVCPCHDSAFDREGQVLRGPAQRPLRRLAATLTAEGDLVIGWEQGGGA